MEAMLGISLCSYLYLKLTKTLCLSYFLFNKTRGRNRFCRKPEVRMGVWGVQSEVAKMK
jgi:hypothetical protein